MSQKGISDHYKRGHAMWSTLQALKRQGFESLLPTLFVHPSLSSWWSLGRCLFFHKEDQARISSIQLIAMTWVELNRAERVEENNTEQKARMVWKYGIGKMDSNGRKAWNACLQLCVQRTLLLLSLSSVWASFSKTVDVCLASAEINQKQGKAVRLCLAP